MPCTLIAVVAQALQSLFKRRRFDIGEHHLHASFGKGPAQRQADAGRAAGDERRLAFEIAHVLSPVIPLIFARPDYTHLA